MAVTTESEKKRYFKLIAKTDDVDKAGGRVIAEDIKISENNYDRKWIKSFSGYIIRADVKDVIPKDPKVKPYKKVALDFRDAFELMQFEFTLSTAGIGLINALLSADFRREIQIDGWINKDGFVGVGARYVGTKDLIGWTVPKEELPKPVEYDSPEGPQKSYLNVKEFWLEKFKDIKFRAVHSNVPESLALEAAAKSEINPKNIKVHPGYVPPSQKPPVDNEDDDLPF